MSIEIKTENKIDSPREVKSFLSASQDKDPMLYPGERPEQSYLTDGVYVYNLAVRESEKLEFSTTNSAGEAVNLNELLAEKGAPLLEDRIPVLGFGANMSPGSLASKFAKIGREDALCVPTAYTTLKGHDVVWSGGPGMNGDFIAVLYDGPEVEETEVQVGVNFLTREQLLVMNATEMAYQLAWADVDIEGHPVRAYYYVGQDQIYIKDGLPVAIDSVPATGRVIEESSTRDLLEEVVSNKEIIESVSQIFPEVSHVQNVEDYLSVVGQFKLEKRSLKLKKAMHEAIAADEYAKKVQPRVSKIEWKVGLILRLCQRLVIKRWAFITTQFIGCRLKSLESGKIKRRERDYSGV